MVLGWVHQADSRTAKVPGTIDAISCLWCPNLKQAIVADKSDLIGATGKSRFDMFGGPKPIKDKASVFALNERIAALTEIDAPPIVPYIAEQNNQVMLGPLGSIKLIHYQKYPYEILFRSITRVLIDNASSEWVFNDTWYQMRNKTRSDGDFARLTFKEVFDPIIDAVLVRDLL